VRCRWRWRSRAGLGAGLLTGVADLFGPFGDLGVQAGQPVQAAGQLGPDAGVAVEQPCAAAPDVAYRCQDRGASVACGRCRLSCGTAGAVDAKYSAGTPK
jgi:hypothetical protein